MAKPHQVAARCRVASHPLADTDWQASLHDRRDSVDDAVTAGEHLCKFSPPSSDLLRALPSEAAVFPPNVAKPHQVAAGCLDAMDRPIGFHSQSSLHHGRDSVDDTVTAGEHLCKFGPPSSDLLRALPSEAAVPPPDVAVPAKVAARCRDRPPVDVHAGPHHGIDSVNDSVNGRNRA